jgi:hypothetical protein
VEQLQQSLGLKAPSKLVTRIIYYKSYKFPRKHKKCELFSTQSHFMVKLLGNVTAMWNVDEFTYHGND